MFTCLRSFPVPCSDPSGSGELGGVVETEVYVVFVKGDVAEVF